MKALLCIVSLAAWMTVGGDATAGASAGSQLPPDKNSCATCHGEKDLWSGDNLRLGRRSVSRPAPIATRGTICRIPGRPRFGLDCPTGAAIATLNYLAATRVASTES